MRWTNTATGKSIEIFNEDCMPALEKMKENEFELAIVDPPYGIGIFTNDAHTDKNGKRIKNIKKYTDDYDWNIVGPEYLYFENLKKISKDRIIWGANYFNCFETNGVNNHGALVWYKGPMTKTISHCEIASLSFQTRVSYIHIDWQSGFYREIKEGIQIHPCQKPIKLYKWLLKNYAKENDRILDTHLGSGSIAIACWDMGFDLVGYELDKDYFEATCKRLNDHFNQQTLGF